MANPLPDAGATTADIRAVSRVATICSLFGPNELELTAADVAQRTGLNRTTAYRYCSSMVAAGILAKGRSRGSFTLGSLMLEIGALALGQQRIVQVAPPHLRALRTAIGRTVVLSLPSPAGPVVTLVEEDDSQAVLVTVRAGTRLDASAAQTHVLLAYGDPDRVAGIHGSIPPGSRAQVDAAVHAVRRQGYGTATFGGSFSVAAPVFDESSLCATIAFLGAGSVDDDTPVEALLDTAGALTRDMGGD